MLVPHPPPPHLPSFPPSNTSAAVLDWLCLHLPERDLPPQYRPAIVDVRTQHHDAAALSHEYAIRRLIDCGTYRVVNVCVCVCVLSSSARLTWQPPPCLFCLCLSVCLSVSPPPLLPLTAGFHRDHCEAMLLASNGRELDALARLLADLQSTDAPPDASSDTNVDGAASGELLDAMYPWINVPA